MKNRKKTHLISKYWKEISAVFFMILLVIFVPLWLALGVLALFLLYKASMRVCLKLKNTFLRALIRYAIRLAFILLISAGSEIFIIEIYKIPSDSMEDSLMTDDVILVNKLVYGPRLINSISEISWINLLFNKNGKESDNNVNQSYKRAKGMSFIKQGDVLVYYLKNKYIVVKRCVAVAGDSFEIINGEIFTTGRKYNSPPAIKNNFCLGFSNTNSFNQYFDKFDKEKKLISCDLDAKSLTVTLENEEVQYLEKDKSIGIKALVDSFDSQKKLFAMPQNTKWTLDNMGPFKIPQKGMQIKLSPDNFVIYGETISKNEHVNISKIGENCYIDGQIALNYVFKQNYYFMMGDNRKASMDSRYVGFIPEDEIVGKASLILYSFNKNSFRLNRMLHIIR